MSKRFNARALLFSSLLALLSVGSIQAQEKNFAPYWAWPNVFYDSFNSFTFGTGSGPTWTANYNLPSGHLYAYPAAIRGYHYGYNPTGDKLFPKKMTTITHIPAAFSFYSYGTNMGGDFTYDLFLRKDNDVKSGESNPQLEVMVWGKNSSYPISTTGKPIVYSAITTNGVTYDLYFGYNSSAKYYTYSFLPARNYPPDTITNGSGTINVDLRDFFNVLKGLKGSNQEYDESTMYLDVVEAGIEVTKGDGEAKLTYFTVDAY